MKKIINRAGRPRLGFYRVLVAAILALGLLLIAGTAAGLVRGRDAAPLFRLGGRETEPAAGEGPGSEGIFAGMGRLRIPAGSSTVILSITFPYPPGDSAFTEELVLRTPDFREAAAAYFSSLGPEELAGPDEDKIKAELLDRFNALLRLGRIQALYFGDFLVVE